VLGALALLALAAGATVGALHGHPAYETARGGRTAGGHPPARSRAARMGLERQVGELLVIAFRQPTAPRYVLRALRDGRAAGVILFGANAASPASVRALTARLQQAAGGDAIVCLDQEGGDVRTLAFAPSAAGQATQSTPAAAGAAATATARALRAAGVNVVLGPVADVAGGRTGSIMAGRAYPGGAVDVSAAVRAAAQAYERAGVVPVLKHFPGLGAATTNTDDAAAVVARTPAQATADLRPYRAALAAPDVALAPLVMVGHARYPALDRHRIASQSRAIVSGLLRGELRFDGVAMTDSLEAEAVHRADPDVGSAGVRSIDAGVDLLLLTGPGSFLPVRDALLAAARLSPAFRARVARAAGRVVALRRTLSTIPH
jgi:beta-N-acetylhexosaminidase